MPADRERRPRAPREPSPYEVEGVDDSTYRPPSSPGPAPAPLYATMPGGVTCHECGYDLGGIATDAPCPECGAGRRRPNAAPPVLSEMPVGFIRLVQLGFACTSVGVVYPIGAAAFSAFRPQSLANVPDAPLYSYIIAAALWSGGLWLASVPPPHESQRETLAREEALPRLSLRWIAVLSQSLWVLSATLLVIDAAANPTGSGGLLQWIGIALCAIGLAGFAPTAMLLARVADFTADAALGMRLRNAVWGMCVCVAWIALARVVPMVLGGGILRAFEWLFWLGLLASLIVFLFSNVILLRLCTLAVGHSRAADGRARRLAEKARMEALDEQRKRAVAVDAETPSLHHYIGTRPNPPPPNARGRR